MSLVHLFWATAARRQAQSVTGITTTFDVLKSFAVRSFHDLTRPLPSLASRSATANVTSVPSLAALNSATPAASPLVWNVWRTTAPITSATGTASALLRALGGIRHASTRKVKPPFQGGKLKPYSAFKSRFKMTGTGKIRYMRPGHVHKRYNKGSRQLQELGETKVMQATYAKTMRRLGFTMRRF